MTLKQKIDGIIRNINVLHKEDPKIYEYWDQLTECLIEDRNETLSFIKAIDNEEVAEDLSTVFDDVALTLQDERFIAAIEELSDKFPEANLSHMVNAAKNNIN
ncbi:hypothetical protein [Hahella sp. CCB-MM4]|uniref:hypothetical protein n=1 Tax=Hahella sp. (strain CCB-MM4) TaxID=1926491 RepID=UPI00113FE623|nr:hypothetical protein [Hahella sp. CCB-MM4]